MANSEWLTQGYFGEQGLVCVCNPAKVCAVPYDSCYGKLRTCEYLPIALCDYDESGHVIPYNVDDGFDSQYIQEVLYGGELSSEDQAEYKLEIPDIPELNKKLITDNILAIARTYVKH